MKIRHTIASILLITVLVCGMLSLINMPTIVKADPGIIHVPGDYTTIQAAVNAANPAGGDTIIVAAGTYDEQVVIDKSLTLQGVGDTTVIQPSGTGTLTHTYTLGTQAGAFWNGHKLASIISVENVGAAGVIIEDLKVDGVNVNSVPGGANYVVGISYGETAGTIDDVTVVDMDMTATDRSYGMWLDAVSTSVSVEVKNSLIDDYNKNGITTRGDPLTVSIHHNTFVGPGTHPVQVPNGIVLTFGCGSSVSYNKISEHHYTGGIWLSFGIMMYDADDGVVMDHNEVYDTDVGIGPSNYDIVSYNKLHNCFQGIELEAGASYNNIYGNDIYDNSYGIHLLGLGSPYYTGPGDEPGPGNTAHYNNIHGNTIAGVQNWDTSQTFDARYNWWGDPTGPSTSPGSGDHVSTYVDYTPWLTREFAVELYIDPTPVQKAPGDVCSTFTVDVTLEDFEYFMGFDIKLTWDSNLISYVSAEYTSTLDALWGVGNWYKVLVQSGAGFYRLAASSTSTAASNAGASDLFTVTLHVDRSCNFELSTPIHFELVKLSDDAEPTPNPIPATVTDGMYKMSATRPDLEFKVKKKNRLTGLYEYVSPPYKLEYCDWIEVEVWVTHICEYSPLTDYHLKIEFDPHLAKFLDVDEWGIFGPGTVASAPPVIQVSGAGAPWFGASGLLFALTFHIEFDCIEEHIWKICHTNYETFQIVIIDAELSFTEGRWIYEDGIDIAPPLTIQVNFIRGDVDCNGKVNIEDISAAAFYYDKKQGDPEWPQASWYDLNCDNIIDIYDIVTIATNYGYNMP